METQNTWIEFTSLLYYNMKMKTSEDHHKELMTPDSTFGVSYKGYHDNIFDIIKTEYPDAVLVKEGKTAY